MDRPRSYLPRPLDPLVGRDDAVEAVARLVGEHRLVTLVGPAGCGKTRLAIAVAQQLEASFPAGTHLIDLTDVSESTVDSLAGAAVDALRLDRHAGVDLTDTLAAGLTGADVLVIFDNCEHLIQAGVELISRLLGRVPSLRVLATSRQPLAAAGEHPWRVEPLPVPESDGNAADNPAVQLFRLRFRQHTGRAMPDVDLSAAASVCRALDGLPLAIELAAGRAPILSVTQIDSMLADRFRLLADTRLRGPSHHRTLRAALDWSYRLLEPDERAMLRRLSVFRGGWTAEAAVALWTAPEAAGRLVEGLVDKSLVVLEVHTGQTRYRLLQSIAAYGAERLAADLAERDECRDRHATYHVELAERAEIGLRGPQQRDWLRILAVEHDNLRAAMAWLGERPDGDGDLRLAAALASFHHLTGDYAEGRRWLGAALARRPGAAPTVRTRAYAGAATLAMLECDYPTAADLAARGLSGVDAAPDRPEYGRLLTLLGGIERERGQYDLSMAHLITARDHFRKRGDSWGAGRAAQMAGGTAWLAGDLEAASELLWESIGFFRDLADDESYASSLTFLGGVAHYRGDQVAARANLAAALDRFAALDFPEGIAWARNLLGLVELREGRIEEADRHLRASLAIHRRVGDRWRTASVLEALAEVRRLRGDPARAAALLGMAEGVRSAIGTPVPAIEQADLAMTVAEVRAGLGTDGFDRAIARGRALPPEEVLDGPPERPAPTAMRG